MGVSTKLVFAADGALEVNQFQDVEPVLNECAHRRAMGEIGTSEMRHAAMLPEVLVLDYLNTHGIDMHEFIRNPEHAKRMLNSPEFSSFRVWQGRV